jgi:hypothetical protein
MNKSISQKFDELAAQCSFSSDPAKAFKLEPIKSFFDSQIKQAAEEIRGKKLPVTNGMYFSEVEAIKFNEGLEAAAQYLESLI